MTTQSPDATEQVEDWPVGDPALNAAWDFIMADERVRIGGMPSLHQIRLIIGHTHRAMRAALPSNATTNASLVEALESIRDVSSNGYDSDRAWALAMQLRAKVALMGWLTPEGNER